MKTRAWLLAALIAAPLGAQQNLSTLTVSVDNGENWTFGPVTGHVDAIQMKLVAPSGEWMLPAFDCHLASPPTGMTWLAASPYGPIQSPSTFGLHSVAGADVALDGDVFEFQAKLGYVNEQGGGNAEGVRSHYVPFWDDQDDYVWKSSSEMWTHFSGGNYSGGSTAEGWQTLNHIDAEGNTDPEVFSVESMFRRAVLTRAWKAGQPNSVANAFFTTPEYESAVTSPTGGEAFLTIQGISLMAPALVGTTTTIEKTHPGAMPIITTTPFARLSNPLQLNLSLPLPDETTVHAQSLVGTFFPGGWRYFTLTNTLPPVKLFFPTQNGLVLLTAVGAATMTEPCRYKIWVPDDVVQGNIYVTDKRQYDAFKIGSVDGVASQ